MNECMPSVFLVPCPAPLARCSVRFSRFRAAPPGPPRLPSGAGAPSSGEEVIYPHGRPLSRKTGDFFGSFSAAGRQGGRAGALSWGNPGKSNATDKRKTSLLKAFLSRNSQIPNSKLFSLLLDLNSERKLQCVFGLFRFQEHLSCVAPQGPKSAQSGDENFLSVLIPLIAASPS